MIATCRRSGVFHRWLGLLTWGGAGVGALKLHKCTVDVKVIALLSADVMTAVRKTVRRVRRPMRAIGPFAVAPVGRGSLYTSQATSTTRV